MGSLPFGFSPPDLMEMLALTSLPPVTHLWEDAMHPRKARVRPQAAEPAEQIGITAQFCELLHLRKKRGVVPRRNDDERSRPLQQDAGALSEPGQSCLGALEFGARRHECGGRPVM